MLDQKRPEIIHVKIVQQTLKPMYDLTYVDW